MRDPIPDPPDDLDVLLAPPTGASPSPELRDAIFRQTGRALARARLVRGAAKAGVVAAVFAAGGLAGWMVKPERVRVDLVPSPAEVVVVPVAVPVPAALPAPGPIEIPPRVEPSSAADAELRAEQLDDAAEAARLYRLAGDKYLNDGQDYRNAARCYRLFLARAGEPGMSPAPGDTWLLTSLKNAAFKEKFHVAKTDG